MFSQLTLAWPQFPVAVVLLLFPLPLFFGKGVEFRELSRSWGRVWTKAISLPWHWIDLGRVGAGVWLLRASTGLQHRTVETTGHTELAVAAGVLIVGMIVQSVACRYEGGFHIPFVYVLAATAAWFPPLLAVLVLISSLAGALACQSLGSFLWWLPVSVGALGVWLYPDWLMLAAGIALSLGGALLPMLFQREFVFAHRALPVDPELLRPLR